MTDYSTYTLPNGLRMIYQFVPSKVSYAGFAVNTGSRDEEKGEEGLAHFVEQVMAYTEPYGECWRGIECLYGKRRDGNLFDFSFRAFFSGSRPDERSYPSFPISRGRSGTGNGGDSR